MNTYGYVSLGDILCKAGYTHTHWTYDNIIFHKELNEQKMPIVPAYVDKSKPYTNVKFNGPATIVFWADGTKTVVKCQDGDDYSEEVGLAMCIVKKVFGNKSKYNDIFKKWCPSYNIETDADDCLSEAYKQFRNHILKTFTVCIC